MGIISYGKNIHNEINLKVKFCYKEKLMKGNNICYENDRKDFVVINKTEIKVIKSFSPILLKVKVKSQYRKGKMNMLKKMLKHILIKKKVKQKKLSEAYYKIHFKDLDLLLFLFVTLKQ